VYRIVMRHNAEIGIRSAPGQGTTFSIQLRVPTQVDAQPAPAPKQVLTGLRL
jgi:signal transduction histidine kinase